MSRRTQILILLGVVILFIAIIGYVLLQRKATPANTNNANQTVLNVNLVNVSLQNGNANTNQPSAGVTTDEAAVKGIAKSFASIYGSFSTQNNYENITELYFYMTPELKTQQEAFVAAEKAKQGDTSLYQGTSSESRIVHLDALDAKAGTAAVTVTLVREATSGNNATTTTYNQNLTLTFAKMDGVWKVGRLAWGAKQ
ncbi:MAG: hypothetical protein WCV85_05665 [Patescibacteria group bacterium]